MSRRLRCTSAAIEPSTFVATSWWLALVAIGASSRRTTASMSIWSCPRSCISGGTPPSRCRQQQSRSSLRRSHPSASTAARRRDRVAATVTWIAVTAVAFAVLSIPGNQLHGTLFGAEEEEELSPLADVVLDAGIALIGALFALIPFTAVVGRPTTPTISPPELAESVGPRPGQRDGVIRSAR